jgi:hypothetical protein
METLKPREVKGGGKSLGNWPELESQRGKIRKVDWGITWSQRRGLKGMQTDLCRDQIRERF